MTDSPWEDEEYCQTCGEDYDENGDCACSREE